MSLNISCVQIATMHYMKVYFLVKTILLKLFKFHKKILFSIDVELTI